MEGGSFYKTIRIADIKEEVKGFKTFVFQDGHNIIYVPGQYLTLVTQLNGEEIRRSYSITSSPVLNEPLSIGVKRVENGFFSRLLIDEAKVGDELHTIGAGGLFTFPEDIQNYNQFFFFAAGSGITPIFSLIKTALHLYKHLHVVLIYSNASVGKTAFLQSLQNLASRFSNLTIEWLFSNAPQLKKARLHRDLIFEFVKRHMNFSKENVLFYICGPESYMRLCTYTLQELGIDKQQIKKEDFYINKIPIKTPGPPDNNNYDVKLLIGSNQFNIQVKYPETILKAAKRQGIMLPYSCEAGRCGNCVAKCISGKVWHSYNEVLTDKELDKGLVLTCVGHPINGNVELKIG